MKEFLTLVILLAPFFCNAQKKVASISLDDSVVFATVDRVGELYVTTKNGQIKKFDINGALVASYKKQPAPTLFEPRDGSRLFAFFRDIRKIEYLKPSFDVYDTNVIDSAFVIEPWLACSFGDHSLLVVDAADNMLKKINPRTSTVEVDVKLQGAVAADLSKTIFMREYQGFIFLLHKGKGIYVYNAMGNLIKTIASPQLPYFNFLGEELYYPINKSLKLVNLFSGEVREIPVSKRFNIALITDERLFLINGNSIDFFEFKPYNCSLLNIFVHLKNKS